MLGHCKEMLEYNKGHVAIHPRHNKLLTLSVAALEVALISQEQQQVDAKGCQFGSTGYNGSQGKCFKG